MARTAAYVLADRLIDEGVRVGNCTVPDDARCQGLVVPLERLTSGSQSNESIRFDGRGVSHVSGVLLSSPQAYDAPSTCHLRTRRAERQDEEHWQTAAAGQPAPH